jgi:putative addiction module component (TIGR02574 family)
MSDKAAALLREALALPAEERAELATSLIDSLDNASDPDVEAAWQEEIARRLEDVRAGRARLIPWDEVRSRARAILNEKAG